MLKKYLIIGSFTLLDIFQGILEFTATSVWVLVYVRSSFFWYVTQRRLIVTDVSGQPIRPILRGPIGCPEMSVTN